MKLFWQIELNNLFYNGDIAFFFVLLIIEGYREDGEMEYEDTQLYGLKYAI